MEKTLLIINNFLYLGGAEHQSRREKEYFITKNYKTAILTFGKKNQSDKSYPEHYNIPAGTSLISKFINKFFNNPFLYKKILAVLYKTAPDIIHLNNIFQTPIPLLKALTSYKKNAKQIRIIKTIRDYSFICPIGTLVLPDSREVCDGYKCGKCFKGQCGSVIKNYIKLKELKKRETKLKAITDQFTAPSETLTKYALKYSYKILHIPNPVLLEKNTIIQSQKKEKYLLYAGNITAHKGIFDIINIYQKHFVNSKFSLLLAGPAVCGEKYLTRMIQNNNNIIYAGNLSHQNLLNKISKARALIVPSIWLENYPNVILEAFALKTLVLGSSRGGIKELLSEKRGLQFNINLKDDIIHVISKALTMTNNDYKQLTDTAHKYLKKNNQYEDYFLKINRLFTDK